MLLGKLIGFLFGGSGVAGVVANGAKLALLTPVVLWLLEHKDEPAITLSWGAIALGSLVVFAIVQVAHVAQPPAWRGPLE